MLRAEVLKAEVEGVDLSAARAKVRAVEAIEAVDRAEANIERGRVLIRTVAWKDQMGNLSFLAPKKKEVEERNESYCSQKWKTYFPRYKTRATSVTICSLSNSPVLFRRESFRKRSGRRR